MGMSYGVERRMECEAASRAVVAWEGLRERECFIILTEFDRFLIVFLIHYTLSNNCMYAKIQTYPQRVSFRERKENL